MKTFTNIVRWLLVAITLTCGAVVMLVAYTVYMFRQIRQRKAVNVRVISTSTRTFTKTYNPVHFGALNK